MTHSDPQYDLLWPYQPWLSLPGYFDGCSEETKQVLQRTVAKYQKHWTLDVLQGVPSPLREDYFLRWHPACSELPAQREGAAPPAAPARL